MNIISITNGKPKMDNGICSYVPYVNGKNIGLGSFFIDGVQIGGVSDCFLTEDNIYQKFYANEVEILENSDDKGVLRMIGYNGKIRLEVDAEMVAGISAVRFTVRVDPELPVTHRLFVKIPFSVEKMDFVKMPFEETVKKDRIRDLRVETSVASVPVIFGRELHDNNKYYIAAGYHLNDRFTDGIIAFESKDSETPFRLYNYDKCVQRHSDMQLTWRNDTLRGINYDKEMARAVRVYRFDVSVGRTQFQCLKSHMDVCGYDKAVTIRRGFDECISDSMSFLKDNKGYEKGKGYHLLVRTDTGEYDNCIVRGGYGVMIPVSSDAGESYNAYRYYLENPTESWAKERAFEMADFYCSAQLPNGAVMMYPTDMGMLDKTNPEDSAGSFFGGYYILLFDVAAGVSGMLKLYQAVKENEGEDNVKWRDAALRAADYICSLVKENGVIGRNYNFMGEYDAECAATADVMSALEYAFRETGNKKYDDARRRIENWSWNQVIDYNLWMNDSNDSGNWDGSAAAFGNNDGMFVPNFISYCAIMHERTKESRYLDMAKDVLMYQWAMSVPVQIEGYKHLTRMLKKEQDFYTNFDPPLMIQEHACGYQYLAKESNEPVFTQLMRIMLQTMIDMQERHDPYKGIHLGLDCDMNTMRPLDRFGEGKQVYVGLPILIYEMGRDRLNYMYVGGKGWGYGLDYQAPFDPADMIGKPYVSSCTSMLRDQSFNPKTNTMRYWIYDKKRNEADLEIVWDGDYNPNNAIVYYNNEKVSASELIHDGRICLHVVGDNSPSKVVQIVLNGSDNNE